MNPRQLKWNVNIPVLVVPLIRVLRPVAFFFYSHGGGSLNESGWRRQPGNAAEEKIFFVVGLNVRFATVTCYPLAQRTSPDFPDFPDFPFQIDGRSS